MADHVEPLERQGQFRDLRGDVWQLRCDEAAIERVCREHRVGLIELVHDRMGEFRADSILIGEILVTLLEDEIVIVRGMTTAAFLARMDCTTAIAAAEAIAHAVITDHPRCGATRKNKWRAAVSKMIAAIREIEQLEGKYYGS